MFRPKIDASNAWRGITDNAKFIRMGVKLEINNGEWNLFWYDNNAVGGVARVSHTPPTKTPFGSFLPPKPLTDPPICKSRPKASQTNPSRPHVYVTRRHGGGAFSEWVAPVKSSTADLHAGAVFGPIWLLVEPGIEFKEAARGGVPSSRWWWRPTVVSGVEEDGYGCHGTVEVSEQKPAMVVSAMCRESAEPLRVKATAKERRQRMLGRGEEGKGEPNELWVREFWREAES
ncbi:hypothetical protein Cgig2_027457 [Carnegiea gigantea]|uniref:Uncharacterized protein n=1 Tax=Carnegiea gigantea TaxID=171969 RepID=A0A9Q1KMT3_9CARY|nr:hypothetical protein Cgig2_027457 [Carnegiea gigantea]